MMVRMFHREIMMMMLNQVEEYLNRIEMNFDYETSWLIVVTLLQNVVIHRLNLLMDIVEDLSHDYRRDNHNLTRNFHAKG